MMMMMMINFFFPFDVDWRWKCEGIYIEDFFLCKYFRGPLALSKGGPDT